MANIATEFGGSQPHSLSEYYSGGGLVPSNTGSIPTSGAISMSQFYGTTAIAVGAFAISAIGTTYWTVPGGVSSISVVAVGAGGNGGSTASSGWQDYVVTDRIPGPGGGGGALVWVNNISVSPGQTVTILIGPGGYGNESRVTFPNGSWISAGAGDHATSYDGTAGARGVYSYYLPYGGGIGGGWGGVGNSTSFGSAYGGRGAGAAGYSGNGGSGGSGLPDTGSGGGSAGTSTAYNPVTGDSSWHYSEGYYWYSGGTGGGGVGLLGKGADGGWPGGYSGILYGGQAGSGGVNGTNKTISVNIDLVNGSAGGAYGAGGGGGGCVAYYNANGYFINWIPGYEGTGASGAPGAVRIIYGPGRFFPNTNTA